MPEHGGHVVGAEEKDIRGETAFRLAARLRQHTARGYPWTIAKLVLVVSVILAGALVIDGALDEMLHGEGGAEGRLTPRPRGTSSRSAQP